MNGTARFLTFKNQLEKRNLNSANHPLISMANIKQVETISAIAAETFPLQPIHVESSPSILRGGNMGSLC